MKCGAGNATQRNAILKTQYRKYFAEALNTKCYTEKTEEKILYGRPVQKIRTGNAFKENIMHKMLCRSGVQEGIRCRKCYAEKCCTENAVQKILCENTVQEMLYRKGCTDNSAV